MPDFARRSVIQANRDLFTNLCTDSRVLVWLVVFVSRLARPGEIKRMGVFVSSKKKSMGASEAATLHQSR